VSLLDFADCAYSSSRNIIHNFACQIHVHSFRRVGGQHHQEDRGENGPWLPGLCRSGDDDARPIDQLML